MEWSKIKNIIILILALVNGFLLVLVAGHQRQVRLYERSALTQAAQVLDQNGITVSEDMLEQAAADSLTSALSAERDLQAEAALARALLGEDMVCSDQSGGLYVYSSERGTALFRSGGDVQFDLTDCPMTDGDYAGHAARLLDDLGLEGELLRQQTTDAGLTVVTFRQLMDGVPLYSCQLEFEYNTAQLLSVSGVLLAAEAAPSGDSASPLDLPTVLIRFLDGVMDLGDVCSAVTDLRLGYQTSQSFGSSVHLTPVWLISTNISNYYLDGITGELTRVS